MKKILIRRYVWLKLFPKPQEFDNMMFSNVTKNMSEYGILLVKNERLNIYARCRENEIQNFTSIEGVTGTKIDGQPDTMFDEARTFRLRKHYIFPLTVLPQKINLYNMLIDLPDFTFGIFCRTIDARRVSSPAIRFVQTRSITTMSAGMTRSSTKKWDPYLDEIKEKAKSPKIFISKIFFACARMDEEIIKSAINFTVKCGEPNSLISSWRKKKMTEILISTPKISVLSSKSCILSSIEAESILALPTDTRTLQVEPGRDRTYANVLFEQNTESKE